MWLVSYRYFLGERDIFPTPIISSRNHILRNIISLPYHLVILSYHIISHPPLSYQQIANCILVPAPGSKFCFEILMSAALAARDLRDTFCIFVFSFFKGGVSVVFVFVSSLFSLFVFFVFFVFFDFSYFRIFVFITLFAVCC